MNDIIAPNKWTLRGRLTDDPRVNDRKNGPGRIANFRLAVNEPVMYQGEIESRELYINVAVFDPDLAEEAASLKKGDRIEATGRAVHRNNKWTDQGTGAEKERWNMEMQITEGMTGFGIEVLERKADEREPA